MNSNLYESASAAFSQTAHNLYVHYSLAHYPNYCQFDHRQILKQAKLFEFLFSIFHLLFPRTTQCDLLKHFEFTKGADNDFGVIYMTQGNG